MSSGVVVCIGNSLCITAKLHRIVVQNLGGKASLDDIYSNVAKHAPDKLTHNANWQAKIRQTLNTNEKMFAPIDRGVWSLV